MFRSVHTICLIGCNYFGGETHRRFLLHCGDGRRQQRHNDPKRLSFKYNYDKYCQSKIYIYEKLLRCIDVGVGEILKSKRSRSFFT